MPQSMFILRKIFLTSTYNLFFIFIQNGFYLQQICIIFNSIFF